ncbi:metalloregulator ArsR/SmtB family transcription factor [Sphingomonas sp. AR_OL41]|uniref:ArsR/SmtB family transcription factor n=1 Tax=Sphingomonas sp. AR_OL41 TaxID=3042729 RepID=UPI0024807431|nr:metalloregulator ArsR/SmtB family transcription factor [Sphingomonas sp. AR_OL41]MDH7972754.1 metalloregulator ArsR/SmtB family transcription factor [Sphingomonas sp. AR_OL41]
MISGASIKALQENAGEVADRLRVLANRDRLLMLCRLAAGEASVSELVAVTGLAQSSVSQHLAVLREAGAVRVRPEQQTRHYSLADPRMHRMIEALCAACGPVAA